MSEGGNCGCCGKIVAGILIAILFLPALALTLATMIIFFCIPIVALVRGGCRELGRVFVNLMTFYGYALMVSWFGKENSTLPLMTHVI